MYELTLSQTATLAQTIDRILTAAAAAEAAIYRADDWYQANIVPAVERMAIAAFIAFIRSAYLTFISGQNTCEWFDAWFAGYVVSGIPAIETVLVEDEILMIEAPKTRIAGLLMPAAPTIIELPGEVPQPEPKAKTETKGNPAPKTKASAGIAPRNPEA